MNTENEVNNMDNTLLRANILGGMNAYIREVVGDDNVAYRWLTFCLPDCCDEETLMEIAENDKEFRRIAKEFAFCLQYAR